MVADASEGAAGQGEPGRLAARVIGALIAGGQTVAAAESLTGGLVTAALTSVPGSSAAVRGGVVAYTAAVKAALLGVDQDLIGRCGTVHRDVAVAMARGAMERLGASTGVATTGVAGPDPIEGHPVGTVHIAACAGNLVRHRALALTGGREEIRMETVSQVLRLLAELLGD